MPVAPYSIDACELLLQSPSFTNAAGLPNAPGDALHRSGQPLKAALSITISCVFVIRVRAAQDCGAKFWSTVRKSMSRRLSTTRSASGRRAS